MVLKIFIKTIAKPHVKRLTDINPKVKHEKDVNYVTLDYVLAYELKETGCCMFYFF